MKTPANGYLSLKTISAKLSLELSLLRFYEKIYSSYLPARINAGDRLVYPAEAIEIFKTIHQLKSKHLSEEEIKSQLASLPHEKKNSKNKPLARIITVTSGKGGVGKSNISLNLAIALRLLDKKVMLIDGDLGLANLHLLAGVKAERTLETLIKMDLSLADIITSGPCGIAMIAGASGIAEMANLPDYKRSYLLKQLEQLEQVADYIIIDTSSGVSPAVLDFIRVADDIMVITTPDLTSLADAYGLIKACVQQKIGSRFGVFTNQVRNLSQAAAIYQRLASCSQQFLHLSLTNLGYMYRDRSIELAVRKRRPFILEPEKNRVSFCIRQLAELLNHDNFDISARKTPAFRRLQNLLNETNDDGRLSEVL
ncbi:MAG: P-loop NTPase [Pseudomonadota bacterium]|nr:P-loop NTPase [Pseudomonadota bacterium]